MVFVPLLFVALAGLLPIPPGLATSPADMLAAVKAYEAAVNRHDWSEVEPLLADEVIVDLGGGDALVGRDAVRRLHGWERSLRTEIHYTDCLVTGDRVTCRAVETNEFTRLAGLEPVVYATSALEFAGGRLTRMSATLDEASTSAVGASLAPFLAWARVFGPASAATFMRPDGSFAFSDEAGEQFTRLLRIYRALRRHASAVRA